MNLNPQSAQLIKSVNEKLPTGTDTKEKEKLDAYWPQFDKNKNGYLSLAEIDQGVKFVLKLPALFPLPPVVKRAFNATKAKMKAMTKYGDDYVSKAEFPYLMQYLRNYYIFWAIFNEIDTDKNKQINLAEFNSAKPIFEANKIPIPDVQ